MNEPFDEYLRWRAAEDAGRADDADRALNMAFRSLAAAPPVSSEFTTRTMSAIAAAAARDASRARRTRVAAIAAGVAGIALAAYYGTGVAVSFAAGVLVKVVNLLVAAIVSGATGAEAGSVWDIVTSLARAAGAFAADPKVTVGMLAIQVLAMAALVALQRLLGSDGESFE